MHHILKSIEDLNPLEVYCIIQREKGVSKTTLTCMLFMLNNKASSSTKSDFIETMKEENRTSIGAEEKVVLLNILQTVRDYLKVTEYEILVSDQELLLDIAKLAEQLCVITSKMSYTIAHTRSPILYLGIAKTQYLREHIFMIIIYCLTEVPLMIIGPPGSSKNFANTIVNENARGEYSKNEFYRVVLNLITFRYQYARQSSINEIATIFQEFINRQLKAKKNDEESRRSVFMDEAEL